jgi:hypothetical protein
MKLLLMTCVFLATLGPGSAAARESSDLSLRSSCCTAPMRWGTRHDLRDARISIRTRDGGAVLLLTDEVVAVQLSDRALRDLRREMRDKEDEDDDSALARAIKVAVLSGVRELLSNSAECPVREVGDVEYRNGHLIITTRDDETIFDDMELSDHEVMDDFAPSDARAFVRAFRRLEAERRR